MMSRTYAAKRLLEHGPLSFGEFVTVTGWQVRQAEKAIEGLLRAGLVQRENRPHRRGYVYRLAA